MSLHTTVRFNQRLDTLGLVVRYCQKTPQWEAADAEIKVPSDESAEIKGSPFKAWSRSV